MFVVCPQLSGDILALGGSLHYLKGWYICKCVSVAALSKRHLICRSLLKLSSKRRRSQSEENRHHVRFGVDCNMLLQHKGQGAELHHRIYSMYI